jgi:hypothetical protein
VFYRLNEWAFSMFTFTKLVLVLIWASVRAGPPMTPFLLLAAADPLVLN